MVFVGQNTESRDALALHFKIDELIRAIEGHDNSVITAKIEPTLNWPTSKPNASRFVTSMMSKSNGGMPMSSQAVPLRPRSGQEIDQELHDAMSWRDWRPVGAAAILALALGGGLLAVFGGVSPYARPYVLAGLTDTVFWLAASIIGACGTIAALMLTTVGLLEHLETERLTPRFLFYLRLIVTAAVTTIALAVFALLLTVFPTSGAEGVTPAEWVIETIYWALLGVTSSMIGGFATVLGGLYTTIGEIFRTLPRNWVEEILTEVEEDELPTVD